MFALFVKRFVYHHQSYIQCIRISYCRLSLVLFSPANNFCLLEIFPSTREKQKSYFLTNEFSLIASFLSSVNEMTVDACSIANCEDGYGASQGEELIENK